MRLEVRQLTKRFETAGERIELFNAFNLELNAGEVKVLMGPSGSGKTTLLKMLCGLEPPDGGTIDYDGKDLYAMSDEARRTFRRANIGFADQAACLLPQLTALENVLLPSIWVREAAGLLPRAALRGRTATGRPRTCLASEPRFSLS